MRGSAVLALCALAAAACDLRPEPPPPVELTSVGDGPKHYDAKRLRFAGTPRPEFIGRHDWTTRAPKAVHSTSHSMFVVPVVPEGWTKADPIPLWISRPGGKTDPPGPWIGRMKEISEGTVVGKVVDYAGREPSGGLGRKESGWQKAIVAAQSEHGIVSDPHAPIVHWPPRE